MDIGTAFWIVWLVALIFGVWSAWPVNRASGGSLVFYVLTFLLGWGVFGFPIHA